MKVGWEFKKLREVCEFINGDRGPNYPGKKALVNEGVPFINAGHLSERGIDWEKMDFISTERFNLLSRGKIRVNDLLFCLRGSLGKTSLVDREVNGAIASSLVILRCKGQIDSRFLSLYCKSQLCFQQIELHAGGAAQPNLGAKDLQSFEIPLPPLEEQRRIVAILDEAFEGLEAAEANAEANLASAEELLGSVVGEYLKNKVQTQRTTTTLKAICSKIGSGATPKGGEKSYKETGVPLVRSLNVYDREFRYGKIAYLDEDQAASLANVTLKQGDVLLNITGASVARCCVLPNDLIGGRVNQHVSIIRIKENILHPELLSYILTSNETKHDLLAVGNTGGTTRQAITKSQIEGFKVSFPTDYQEQSKLVVRLQQIEKCVLSSQRNLRDKSIEVSELRQSLLQKAFAGELT